jgi:hypothetical protein
MKIASLFGTFVLAMAVTGAAFAGETKGPPGEGGAQGGPTPIDGFWTGDGAGSICSFSGLNDVIDETEPTQTQSYGTFMTLLMHTLGISSHEAKDILVESPGEECNPTRAPFGNPKRS